MKCLYRFPMASALLLALLVIICASLTVVYLREAPAAFSGQSLQIPLARIAHRSTGCLLYTSPSPRDRL